MAPARTYDSAVVEPGSPRLVALLGEGVIDDPDRAVLRADDLGLTRGDGCFDATRIVTEAGGTSHIAHLDAHLARFERSAAGLELPFDAEAWRSLVADAAEAWRHPGDAVIRVMLTRGRESAPNAPVTGVLTIAPLDATSRAGIAVITLDRGHTAVAFDEVPWLLGGIKTLSYAINVAAGREAKRRGADDALFVSTEGYALEAPRSAVVWRIGDGLATTRLDGTGILASITQATTFEAAVAEGMRTDYDLITIEDLVRTDGAWLLSSGRLVAPIASIDDVPMAQDVAWSERLRNWATAPTIERDT